MKHLLLILPVLLAGVLSATAAGQETPAEPRLKLNLQELGIAGLGGTAEPVTLSASFTVERGGRRGMLAVTAVIEPGWHVYSVTQKPGGPQRTTIDVSPSDSYKVVGAFAPDQPPHIRPPDVFKVESEEHSDVVTWSAPIELSATAKPEALQIPVKVSGQVCKTSCMNMGGDLVATFKGYAEPSLTPGEYRPDPKEAEAWLAGHIEPAAVRPGGKAKLVITATPTNGWHVYEEQPIDPDTIGGNKPTLIVVSRAGGWTRSAAEPSSEPINSSKAGELPYYDKPVTWTIELTVPGDSPQGEYVVSGYVGYQTCKEGCLPPHAAAFRAAVPVASEERAGKIPLEFSPAKYRDVAKAAKENPAPTGKIDWASLAPIVGFSLLGGLILNLMPCVLPVIGLKVLSFVQQGGESRARIFALNVWFAAGLLLVFVLLATLAAFGSLLPFLGENLAWGQQFTYTGFKVAMVVVVFAFALSFLGVWEVPIPGFAQSSASGKLQQKEGASGAFFKGIFTTLLATPCSGPFLGPVFAYTLAQPPLVTYIVFLGVGLGMALPYVVIGAFPGLVRWLPKPGPWMDTLKQLMGFVLLGTVVYLFATINAAWFIPTLALMMGVWLACWWIGRVPIYDDTSKQVWAWVGGCAAAALVGYLSFTFLGPREKILPWQPYSAESLAKLQAEGKTVMIDFTADWCPTCQSNMVLSIDTRRVEEVVKKNNVVPLVADWTDKGPAIAAKLYELNSNSIPLLAIYPASRPGEVIVLRDIVTQRQVIEALEKAGPSKPASVAEQASAEVHTTAITDRPG